MSKRTKIILASAIVIILIVVIVLAIIKAKNDNPSSGTNANTSGIFGTTSLAASEGYSVNTTSIDSSNEILPGGSVAINANALTHLSSDPIAGATAFETSTSTTVRYVERATGHVTDIDLASGNVSESSDTTIPKIYQAIWFNKGTSVMLRYLGEDAETIETYSADVVAPNTPVFNSALASTTGMLEGEFLPQNIQSLALSPSGSKVFYITGTAGNAAGSVSNTDGSKPSVIFNSPLSEWQVSWPQTSTITLTTNASSGINGFLYFLNPTTGSVKKILDSIDGLTTLTNPTASLVAFSDSSNDLQIYNVKTNTTTSLNIQTLPEKCVWSQRDPTVLYCAVPTSIPFGAYPDSWYQGTISFTDSIYKINTTDNTVTLVSNMSKENQQNIDAIDISLTPAEDYLLFTDKKDLTLWSLRIASTSDITLTEDQ